MESIFAPERGLRIFSPNIPGIRAPLQRVLEFLRRNDGFSHEGTLHQGIASPGEEEAEKREFVEVISIMGGAGQNPIILISARIWCTWKIS